MKLWLLVGAFVALIAFGGFINDLFSAVPLQNLVYGALFLGAVAFWNTTQLQQNVKDIHASLEQLQDKSEAYE